MVRWSVGLALGVLTLATRLPFATEYLWAHDSVLYARAIDDFDPGAHQPQPPGYLYYVLLVRALATLTGDANRAMTLVSAFAAAAAVVLLYGFTARLHGERTARGAALLLLTSAAFWGYGAVAYPYTLLAALTIACAWLLWRVIASAHGRGRRLVAASAAWGVAMGFRLDLVALIAPLWLLAAFVAGRGSAALAASVAGAFFITWLALTSLAADGLGPFLEATSAQTRYVSERHGVLSNGLAGLRENAYDLVRFAARALYATVLPLAAVVLWPRARGAMLTDGLRTGFVVLWALAPIPLYLLVHIGDIGYAFSFLPAVCVLAARALAAAGAALRSPGFARATLAAVAIVNALIFLYTDVPASASELARRDDATAEKIAYIDRLAARREVVVVAGHDRAAAHHYVGRRHRLVGYSPDAQDERLSLVSCNQGRCRQRLAVVIWDDSTSVLGTEWRAVRLRHGARLRIAEVTHARELSVRTRNVIELSIPR